MFEDLNRLIEESVVEILCEGSVPLTRQSIEVAEKAVDVKIANADEKRDEAFDKYKVALMKNKDADLSNDRTEEDVKKFENQHNLALNQKRRLEQTRKRLKFIKSTME